MFDLPLTSLTLQPPFALSQLLTFNFPGKQDQIQIAIEHDKDHTIFVGFGTLGNELFTILIQNGKLVTTGAFKEVNPKFIVDHFMLTFLPVEDLQDDLKQEGYHLQQAPDGETRTLLYGGRRVMEISYSDADYFSAEVRLNHRLLNYTIFIKNAKKSTAHE